MKFLRWLMVFSLLTTAVACGGTEPEVEDTAPGATDTELMEEEPGVTEEPEAVEEPADTAE